MLLERGCLDLLDIMDGAKFNGAGRYSFEEAPYRLTNWPAYNESLRQRG